MFSFFKNASTSEEVALQELSEEQLAQVAGGRSNDHDWDDRKKVKHHHHHHHIVRNDHDWDDRKKMTMNTTMNTTTTWGSHW